MVELDEDRLATVIVPALEGADAVVGPIVRWEGGLRVPFAVDGYDVALDLHARTEGEAYGQTDSLTIYLRWSGGGSVPMAIDAACEAAIAALDAADDGTWEVPKGDIVPEVTPPPPPPPDPFRDGVRWRADLHARLVQAATLAASAAEIDEAYPFSEALGGVAGDAEDVRTWVLAHWPAGFTKADFVDAFGPERAPDLMRILTPLVQQGVALLDDTGVAFHPGVRGDVAIWGVWVWSDAVRDAAAATWPTRDGARAWLDARADAAEASR